MLVITAAIAACGSSGSSSPVGDAGAPPVVAIERPHEGESFAITPTEVDVPIAVSVAGFTLVPLGEEGTDMRKGQVRMFVDGPSCNDLGHGADAPRPYATILPSDGEEPSVGLDYCAGGVPALDGTQHILRAELWHGEVPIAAVAQVSFATTFSYGDAGQK